MNLLSGAQIPFLWQYEIIRYGEFTKTGDNKTYVADFLLKAKSNFDILVEIDGDVHNGKEDYDLKRDRYLESRGYRVMHFTNRMVLHDGRKVIEGIQTELRRVKAC